MKRLFFSLLVMAFSITVMAQKPLSYSTVIQADSLSAAKLYQATKAWFSNVYVRANYVVQNDIPNKEVSGRAKLTLAISSLSYSGMSGFITYFIDVQFRDNRLKFTMSDFTHEPLREVMYNNHMGTVLDSLPDDLKTLGGDFEKSNHRMYYKAFWKRAKPACDEQFKTLSESLTSYINKYKPDSKEENW